MLLLVGVWAVLGAVIVGAAAGATPSAGSSWRSGSGWASGLAADRGAEHLGTGAVLTWVSWFSEWFWIVGFGLVIASLFFIPTGRLPSRGWLPVLLVFSAAVVACASSPRSRRPCRRATPRPDRPQPDRHRRPRRHRELVRARADRASSSAAPSPAPPRSIVRYRQGNAEERQQLKLLALAAPFAVVCVVVAGRVRATEPLEVVLWDVGMTAIPVAVTVAILRYRLSTSTC